MFNLLIYNELKYFKPYVIFKNPDCHYSVMQGVYRQADGTTSLFLIF